MHANGAEVAVPARTLEMLKPSPASDLRFQEAQRLMPLKGKGLTPIFRPSFHCSDPPMTIWPA